MLIALGLILFIFLVVVHEFGHFMAAKKLGVEVEEFGIGFPPRLFKFKRKKDQTIYSINLLPIGGFVKLKGEHDADTQKGSYGLASFKRKTVIILAGVFMNFVVAGLILSVLSFTGLPKLIDNQFAIASDTVTSKSEVLITHVEENTPAQQAGIEVGDKLVSINYAKVETSDKLSDITEQNAGQAVPVVYVNSHNNQIESVIILNDNNNGEGYLGVAAGDLVFEKSTWSAPIRGFGLAGQFSWLTLKGVVETLGDLFSGHGGEAAQNVTGPVGIVFLLKDVSQAGVPFVIMFIALISVTLAVINILPIPALDGGRLFVSGLYKISQKPLSAKTEERIHGTGMAVLLLIVMLVTVIDVRRFF